VQTSKVRLTAERTGSQVFAMAAPTAALTAEALGFAVVARTVAQTVGLMVGPRVRLTVEPLGSRV
jgi:hypothetical protein